MPGLLTSRSLTPLANQPIKTRLALLAWLPLYFTLSLACLYWQKQPGSLIFTPFANALLLICVLQYARTYHAIPQVLGLILLALSGDVLLYYWLHYSLSSALILSLCNGLQIALSYHFCRDDLAGIEENPSALLRFFALACCLPAYFSGSLATIWFLLENQALSKGLGWMAGNILVNLLSLSLWQALKNTDRESGWPAYSLALVFFYLAFSLLCLVFLPYPLIYLNAALLLAAVFCPFYLAAVVALVVLITLQIALPLGYFSLPPMTSHWQLLLYAVPLFLMLLTPLLLSASMQQARSKVRAQRRIEEIASKERSEKSLIHGKLVLEQKASQETAEKLNALLYQINDAVIGMDANGLIETFNPAAEQLYGVSAAQIIGKNYYNLFAQTGTSLDISESHLPACVQCRFDGSEFMADISACRYHTDTENKTLLIIRDLTQQLKIKKFNADFVSTVSHELRTPLTSIRAALSFLANDIFDSNLSFDSRKMVKIALSNSERLGHLINDLLDMQKIEAGKMDFRFETCVLEQFLLEVIQANQTYAEKFQIKLVLQNTVPYGRIWVDKHRLMQVMTNLVSNACKFSQAGQSVEMIVESGPEASLHLIVRDHGKGIEEKFIPQLFQRYSQFIHSESRAQGGTGLGLAISYNFIQTMGGQLSYQATPGGGSSFVIRFKQMNQQE